MSDFVVHFTKEYDGKNPYDNMLSILGNRTIRALNPFGIAHHDAPNPSSQHVVCFSEIPLHLLKRLAKKRKSKYGIVFRKDFVIHRHGNPILYAYKDQPVTEAIKKLMAAGSKDSMHPIWQITPFVDSPGQYQNSSYFFEWEREWRKVGQLNFDTNDVAFLIVPEDLHEAAKGFFEYAGKENLGPAYDCPLIDPYWPIGKIEPLLALIEVQD